eukprot:COSAG01_NODE_5155_length_4447_cov_8.318767_3_plen_42_part_00
MFVQRRAVGNQRLNDVGGGAVVVEREGYRNVVVALYVVQLL